MGVEVKGVKAEWASQGVKRWMWGQEPLLGQVEGQAGTQLWCMV